MKLDLIADKSARVVSFNIKWARNESNFSKYIIFQLHFVHDDCPKFQVKFVFLCLKTLTKYFS